MSAGHLDSDLGGSLPCLVCGYELKGLSIRGVCPECGTAIRATILYKVDPRAEEFRPVRVPFASAWLLVLWSVGALLAALAGWGLRLEELIEESTGWNESFGLLAVVAVAAAALSGLGSVALIAPVAGTSRSRIIAALVGTAAYVPLVWVLWRVFLDFDPHHSSPYFSDQIGVQRIVLRLIASASMIIIILGLRPNARDLVKRSMVMRTGKVDRQTLLVMTTTIALTMAGDGLRLAAAASVKLSYLALVGTVFIAVGSFLFTLGLGAALVDSWRISRAILIPSPSMKQVLGHV